MVQINAVKVEFELVGIGHAHAVNGRRAHNLGSAILLFIQCNVGIYLQVIVYCIFSGSIAGKCLKNITE